MAAEEDFRPEVLTADELEGLSQELGGELTREQLLAVAQFIREAGDLEDALAMLESLDKAA